MHGEVNASSTIPRDLIKCRIVRSGRAVRTFGELNSRRHRRQKFKGSLISRFPGAIVVGAVLWQ
jgi:hypothetical protein